MNHSQINGIFIPLNTDGTIDMSSDEGKSMVYGALRLGTPSLEFRRKEGGGWESSRGFVAMWKLIDDYQFRMEPAEEVPFPEIGTGEEWHNPLHLSPKKFGSHNGWRPALRSELDCEWANSSAWEVYFPDSMREWYANTRLLGNKSYPYRTRNPLPESALPVVATHIDADKDDNIATAFHKLSEQWRRETGMDSIKSRTYSHPAYHAILALGPDVIPFILAELPKKSGHWFEALRVLSKESPAENCTSVSGAREIWIKWGHEKGLIS